MNRQSRIEVANEFIKIVASHGRRFFSSGEYVSKLELDRRGLIWFIDARNGARVYTHTVGRWRKFHHGGTLKSLVEALRDFVMGRRDLPTDHLGPWPDWYGGGDLWGYGEAEMAAVRGKAIALDTRIKTGDVAP